MKQHNYLFDVFVSSVDSVIDVCQTMYTYQPSNDQLNYHKAESDIELSKLYIVGV